MKQITTIFLIIINFLFINSLHAQLPDCSEIRTELNEKYYLSGCCVLDSSGDYILNNDVSSAGTCFSMQTGNFTFDLNGKTVEYAQSGPGTAFRDDCSACSNMTFTSTNAELKKGTIMGGRYTKSHAFSFVGVDDISISNLIIAAAGEDTQGILVDYGKNLVIHDVDINIDAQKSDPCSHYDGHLAGISLNGRSGETLVYNNRITGKTMRGIKITGCGLWEKDMLIHDNYISLESMINDGYAISMEGNGGICSSGTKIYNNIINQVNGRGIIVAGWNSPNDIGPGNFDIYNNSIFVREGSDCENGGAPGRAVGIRLRFGAHDYSVVGNYIKGYAGKGIGVNHSVNYDGGGVVGMSLTTTGGDDPKYRSLIVDNLVDVETNVADNPEFYYAEGILVTNYDNRFTPKHLINNTIKSNDMGFYSYRAAEGDVLQDIYTFLERGTFIKGLNPTDRYRDVFLGWWNRGASNTHFLDMTGDTGSGFHLSTDTNPALRDFHMYDSATTFENIDIKWTMKVRVEDGSGNPVEGANVKIEGPKDEFTGSTDHNGFLVKQVLASSYQGSTVLETVHNPYTIEATYNDGTILHTKVNATVFVNGPTFPVLKFDDINNPQGDITPPVIENGNPRGTLMPGTTATTISVNTNEVSFCKYSEQSKEYSDMEFLMASDQGILHQATVSNLLGGQPKNYFVRCRDNSSNHNTNTGPDYHVIAFWVAYDTDSEIIEDTVAPARINDLSVACNLTSCRLLWTAPGDNGYTGIASKYDVRYSLSNDLKSSWDSFIKLTGEPSPNPSGTLETFTVSGLIPHTTYWFSIQTADAANNLSSISDPVSGTTEETEPEIQPITTPSDSGGSGLNISGGCGIISETTSSKEYFVIFLSILSLLITIRRKTFNSLFNKSDLS